ncbi:MAG: 30S ribosomal protein S8 [Coriobacteriia bacterium]|nr:30S ribosomal protein S8 [Coriobacteriia bacterium]MCL2870408.1 30S ribosomal protein S8 [Coriobacteriia bacterium]
MMMTDTIADMLTRIRNANMGHKPTANIPYSKKLVNIARVLKDAGYIRGYSVESGTPFDTLVVELKYTNDKTRVITGIRRISKPGLRVYAKKEDLPRVLGGLGIAIVSTSSGVMTDAQAREKGVGGEVLAYVW